MLPWFTDGSWLKTQAQMHHKPRFKSQTGHEPPKLISFHHFQEH